METVHQERAWDSAEHIYKLKNADEATFETPIEAKGKTRSEKS